jgi:hypothetical protein
MVLPARQHDSYAWQPSESAGVLRWTFLRGTKAMTCAVRFSDQQMYDVCVVPHWDVSSSVIETFERPASALHRHAQIASSLREAGWTLVRDGYTSQAR